MPKHIAVIGAGPAGLTAAYQLSKSGHTVEVFEADASVGGLSKTIELWGQRVDIGPHRFYSSDPRVNQLWLEIVGRDYQMVNRLTRIYYQNKFFHYPLKPIDALQKLGPGEAVHCLWSYLQTKLAPPADRATFENWVVSRFGRRLFEIFFKSYSEKLWGITCQELDSDFAAQRIKKFSLLEAIKHSLPGFQPQHKTLVDQFAYPNRGTGSVYTCMAERIQAQGGQIHLNTPVESIVAADGVVTGLKLKNAPVRSYDTVISTMPLTQMVRRLPEVPASVVQAADQLRFRNTILVYLQIESPRLFPDNWIYVHSPDLKTGRITNFRNWSPELFRGSDRTILCLEFWCYTEDPLWSESDEALIKEAVRELRATHLIAQEPVSDGFVYRIKNSYPVYRMGYRQPLGLIQDYLKTVAGLQVIGRYGAFKYNNQDHSILMGILAAENIGEGRKHNLWDVNTDYEYGESTVITATGLQKRP
jgi:protoporphyrinogen oxidase